MDKITIIKIEDIFKHLEVRPYFFIHKANVEIFHGFINGLRVSQISNMNGIENGLFDFGLLDEFSDFILEENGVYEYSSTGWMYLKELYSGEEQQFKAMLSYWKKFLETRSSSDPN